MIIDELAYQIKKTFGFTPTAEQAEAINVFCHFITDRENNSVMIMRGSAGTGKTTLAAAIVKTMVNLSRNVMLLAPTGRAAKVFSLNAGHAAFTIHRKIYRQKSFNGDIGKFELGDNKFRDMLFMVDEASMIANDGISDMAFFGTGRLLDDIISFVYKGRNCRMLLVGDKAQLPPVGEEESPALMPNVLKTYGLKVYCCDLNEVLRQSINSGILYNATVIRQMITHDEMTRLPQISFDGFADIQIVPGNELIEQLNNSYSEVGIDETMVITRSNKRANVYNAGIRNMVLGREEQLSTGDMLMVVRNNYYWVADEEKPDSENKDSNNNSMAFIANGDRACIQKVSNIRELYGFHFADVNLMFPDYDEREIKATVIMDSLTAEAPSLTRQQGEDLFNAIMEDYADIPTKAERIKKIRQDPYFNAIQIKYAYAVTCHKAQGGQWAHIYLDQGYMTDDMLSPDYIHWLYTAFTRANEKLFLVNWLKT